MTKSETLGCISLMTLLWTNYKPPANNAECDALVKTWLTFFANVPASEVTRAIHAIAAEGGEFAPQLGQIYKAVKEARQEKLTASRGGELYDAYFGNCCVYADFFGLPRPAYGDNLRDWFVTNVRRSNA